MMGIAQNSFIMLMLLAIFFLGACQGQWTTGFVGAKGKIVGIEQRPLTPKVLGV